MRKVRNGKKIFFFLILSYVYDFRIGGNKFHQDNLSKIIHVFHQTKTLNKYLI